MSLHTLCGCVCVFTTVKTWHFVRLTSSDGPPSLITSLTLPPLPWAPCEGSQGSLCALRVPLCQTFISQRPTGSVVQRNHTSASQQNRAAAIQLQGKKTVLSSQLPAASYSSVVTILQFWLMRPNIDTALIPGWSGKGTTYCSFAFHSFLCWRIHVSFVSVLVCNQLVN